MPDTVTKVFRCWRCDKRLPIDEVNGTVVVICRQCRVQNRISS